MPQLGASGEDECGEDADGDAANDVREEHERPRGESVAERTTEEHERGARDRGGHQDRAEHEAGAGQLERQPGERDEVELVAEDADRLAGEEEAEVADAAAVEAARGRDPADVSAGVAGATVGESSPVAIFVTPR